MNYVKTLIISLFFAMMTLSIEKNVHALSLDGSSEELFSSSEEQHDQNSQFLNRQLIDYFRSEIMKRSFRARALNNRKPSFRNYFYEAPIGNNEEANVNSERLHGLNRKRAGKFAIPRMG